MAMKSVAIEKVSPGDEIPRSKSSTKLTKIMKRRESTKYAMSDNDSLCGIEIYEVVGNVPDGGGGTLQVQNQSESHKKLERCEESIVSGGEVLLRRANHKNISDNRKEEGFVGVAYIVEGQRGGKEKVLALPGQNSHEDVLLATGTLQNGNGLDMPEESVEINNTEIILSTQLDVQNIQDCELVLVEGSEPISSMYSPVKTITDPNSKEIKKEGSIDVVSPKKEAKEEDVEEEKDVMEVVETYENEQGTKSGIIIGEENKENKGNEDGQDSTSKIEQDGTVENCNGVEELVVSSGPAWDTKVQLRTDYFDSVANNDEDESEDDNVIGELKVNDTGSLEFIKRYVGESVRENETGVDARARKIVEESREEGKRMVVDEGMRSPVEKDGIEESGKRKRIPKGEGTRELSLKKRKTEKCKRIELSDHSDSEREVHILASRGRSNGEKSTRREAAKSASAICDQTTLEETIDRVASGHLSLPFLENLRGSIRNLSRGDLEELIVQKLCEVITERSTVGLLRKRAEALERNQERWKEKVLSLTKQIKEMDMVMKKYLSEVRRHHTERSIQMIAPLRVTRSVGLQVSFTSAPSRLNKSVPNGTHVGNRDVRHGPDRGMKQQMQRAVFITQNPKKNISLPTTPVKKSLVIDQKNKVSPKSRGNFTVQTRAVGESPSPSKPAAHVQPNRSKAPAATVGANSTSLIDLTDDDDRQGQESGQTTSSPPSVTVRPPGQIRVVNHIQPAQSSASRVTYLVPNATTSAGSSTTSQTSTRQLLFPSSSGQQSQRHILPSVPPLLYKGSTLVQPGSQQQAVANQSRALMTNPMKHPAPLPQPPLNQMQNPNWKLLPPRPALKISKVHTGIVLSWNMTLGPEYETISSYQLFAYQENDAPPTTSLWKKVGDVKALPLPMACTLTQFMSGHKYYFAVRAVDLHSRIGPFSFPGSIVLIK